MRRDPTFSMVMIKNLFCEESLGFWRTNPRDVVHIPNFHHSFSKPLGSNLPVVDGFRLERLNANDLYIRPSSIQFIPGSLFFLPFQPSLPKPGENRSCSESLSFHPARRAGDFGKIKTGLEHHNLVNKGYTHHPKLRSSLAL